MEDGWNICYNDDIQRRRRHTDEAMLFQEQQIHIEASSKLKLYQDSRTLFYVRILAIFYFLSSARM